MGGPAVKGTWLAVEFVVALLAQGWTHEQTLDNCPSLARGDILACLAYAGATLP